MGLSSLAEIILAALLHDIGKFYQRTGLSLSRPKTWADYIPGEYTYLHALYTYQFFAENEELFERIEGKSENRRDETALINLASRHHKPSNPYESIITFADHLSSGLDRKHYDELEQEKDVNKFRQVRLKPIFEEIRLEKHDYRKERFIYTLTPFTPENIFPKLKNKEATKLKDEETEKSKDEGAKKEYNKLWQGFIAGLKSIKYINFDHFFNGLKSLLETYTWCIPSATIKTVPDISLYDHLTTTAAIATALFKYYETKGSLDKCNLNYLKHAKEEQFCFIMGDFSGIQQFIFDRGGSANKYAAKILRAKSLFVSLATEIAAYQIIKALGLNSASILSVAAGKFFILAPNVDETVSILQDLRDKICYEFHKRFYGEVSFIIAYLNGSGSVFDIKNYTLFMSKLSLKLEEEKLKPFHLRPELFVFTDYLKKISSSEDVCAICGKRPKERIQDDIPICNNCEAFREIGDKFVKSRFIEIGEGLKYQVIGKYGFDFSNSPHKKADLVYQYGLRDGEFFEGYPLKYLASYVPKFAEKEWQESKYEKIKQEFLESQFQQGDIKSFYHLACDARIKEGDKCIGSQFLGVLKADVDNLGKIFRIGLKRKEGDLWTISRYAYVSRMLNSFFSVYLPFIIEQQYQSIYTIFAGGDDLFLIGPYNQIYEFSKNELGNRFPEYVCQNPDITISAGIVFAKPVVPVREMAEDVERTLDRSKHHEGKGAITILSKSLKWQSFLKLTKFEEDIEEIEESAKERLPMSYLYRLLTWADWAERAKQEPLFVKWRALFAYSTARNFGNKSYYEELLKLPDKWIDSYKSKLIIPLSMVIYRRRK